MPPVSGLFDGQIQIYVRFTEEWSELLARGSCRGDEEVSIGADPLCRSTLIPELGPSLIHDRIRSRSHQKLPYAPRQLRTLLMCFISQCLGYAFLCCYFRFSFRLREKRGNPSNSSWNSFGSFIDFYYIYSVYELCDNHHVLVDPSARFIFLGF